MRGVAQVVDSLALGGTERVAVQVANELHARGVASHLVTTRGQGPLTDELAQGVRTLHLARRSRLAIRPLLRLAAYLRENEVDVLHAHSSSLFVATAAAKLVPRARVVWHDHYGEIDSGTRPDRLYGVAARSADAVISVNRKLERWARQSLGVARDRSFHLPNWAPALQHDGGLQEPLPGAPSQRVVCVANLRPQKGHVHLIRAFAELLHRHPAAELLLVGSTVSAPCKAEVQRAIADAGVESRIHFLGRRRDVASILDQCAVGVLASVSEGLPLSLLEYGRARLPVVATDVGDCREALADGAAGLLVPPGQPGALATALGQALEGGPDTRRRADLFAKRIDTHYSAASGIERLFAIYQRTLDLQEAA